MIEFLGPLTEADKQLLIDHRQSELFKTVRKLIAHEYFTISRQLTAINKDDFSQAQGHLLMLDKLNNLLLHYSTDPTNVERGLKVEKKVRNLKT